MSKQRATELMWIWLKGLLAAAITGAAAIGGLPMVDPVFNDFNLLLKTAGWMAFTGAMAYMKQSPLTGILTPPPQKHFDTAPDLNSPTQAQHDELLRRLDRIAKRNKRKELSDATKHALDRSNKSHSTD